MMVKKENDIRKMPPMKNMMSSMHLMNPYVKWPTHFQSNATNPIQANQDWSRIGNNANPTPMQLKCPELEFMSIEPMDGKCCNYSSIP